MPLDPPTYPTTRMMAGNGLDIISKFRYTWCRTSIYRIELWYIVSKFRYIVSNFRYIVSNRTRFSPPPPGASPHLLSCDTERKGSYIEIVLWHRYHISIWFFVYRNEILRRIEYRNRFMTPISYIDLICRLSERNTSGVSNIEIVWHDIELFFRWPAWYRTR